MTEREISLIKDAQGGDSRAFGELVALYDRKVMNLALSLLGSEEDARDIYQEIFTKVFKSLKKFRFQSAFYTWLYRITVNTCLTYRKSRGRMKERIPISLDENSGMMDCYPDEKSAEADSDLLAAERSLKIKEAIDRLPPKQKAVVILRHYQEKKIREIAEIMDLHEGTVKGYLFRALNTLKTNLQPYY